jgi:hypothetical protein
MLWKRENLLPLQVTELQFLGSPVSSLVTIAIYTSARYNIPAGKKSSVNTANLVHAPAVIPEKPMSIYVSQKQ